MVEISISPEKIFSVYGLPVTNTLFLSYILVLVIAAVYSLSFIKAKMLPGKLQNFFEMTLEKLFNFFKSITGSEERAKEIFPLAATLFILILSSNLIELLPGIGVFHFLRSPSSDLNFTIALSLISISYINIMAVRKLGIFRYLQKFLNFSNPINFFVGILEGISEATKILSLSFRLFGNLFAGETLLIVSSFLFAYLMPLPFLGLEILVGFIQAIIFSSLVVIFYVSAIETVHE